MTDVCKRVCHPSLIVPECLCMQRHRHCRDEASLHPAAAICMGHLWLCSSWHCCTFMSNSKAIKSATSFGS